MLRQQSQCSDYTVDVDGQAAFVTTEVRAQLSAGHNLTCHSTFKIHGVSRTQEDQQRCVVELAVEKLP